MTTGIPGVDLWERLDASFTDTGIQQPQVSPNEDLLMKAQDYALFQNMTTPAGRPSVSQRGLNYQLTVGINPTPMMIQRFDADLFIVQTPSNAANSVFFGYGKGIATGGPGQEITVGSFATMSLTNDREQWELQRAMEYIAAVMGNALGTVPLTPYRAPRVVLNLSEWFLVAVAATVVNVLALYVPEMQ